MQNTTEMPNPIPPARVNPLGSMSSVSPNNNMSNTVHQYHQYSQSVASTKPNKGMYTLMVICILLLIYCTCGITYLLLVPQCSCLNVPTTSLSTKAQSNSPTISPSISPSPDPTASPTTQEPTVSPSNVPTLSPTINENYIGDYKISAQNSSHGSWLLCDGSFIDPNIYPQLFTVIGYSFGNQISGTVNEFALPDASDRIVGVQGSNMVGKVVGNETISLKEDNLPSHFHYLMNPHICQGNYNATSRPYLAEYCDTTTGVITSDSREYNLQAVSTSDMPGRYRSSSIGSGTAISIMQPTLFIGNLFVFAD